jgi:hypothetical protein
MKKTGLTLAGLLVAVCAFAKPDCTQKMSPANGPDEFAIVSDQNGKLARAAVAFCEDADYVVDIFYIGKSVKDGNDYYYIHELILNDPNAVGDGGWYRMPKALDNSINEIVLKTNGDCYNPGDFTRSVSTGSGHLGGGTGKYIFCGHGKPGTTSGTIDIKWDKGK